MSRDEGVVRPLLGAASVALGLSLTAVGMVAEGVRGVVETASALLALGRRR